MSNKTYKMIERQNGILLSPTDSDLFSRARGSESRNVLLYLSEEDINGESYHKGYPLALGLSQIPGFEVCLATEPKLPYSRDADIIINGIRSKGFLRMLSRLNGNRVIITNDDFRYVKNSRDLRNLARRIDEEVSELKEGKEAT